MQIVDFNLIFQEALLRLESLLSKDFGIHWYHEEAEEGSSSGREGISDLQLRQAMIQIKDDRRRDHIKDVGSSTYQYLSFFSV